MTPDPSGQPPAVGDSRLAQLRTMSVVVADTGDLDAVRRLRPVDCTTNPSLVRKALDLPAHADMVDAELAWGRRQPGAIEAVASAVVDRLAVGVGARLLEMIPGRVSTEVDADLSLDTDATVAKARALLDLYAAHGIGRERVLIKIAATWDGIRAVEVLQRDGIDCNVTLVFNHAQALACAEAGRSCCRRSSAASSTGTSHAATCQPPSTRTRGCASCAACTTASSGAACRRW